MLEGLKVKWLKLWYKDLSHNKWVRMLNTDPDAYKYKDWASVPSWALPMYGRVLNEEATYHVVAGMDKYRIERLAELNEHAKNHLKGM